MWVSDGGGRGGVQSWAALRSPARLAQLLLMRAATVVQVLQDLF